MTESFTKILGIDTDDRTGYIGFPPYKQDNYDAPYTIVVELNTEEDVKALVDKLGKEYESLLEKGLRSTKSYWYPALERGARGGGSSYIWVDADDNNYMKDSNAV